MARTEARIFSRVWSDQDQADFRALNVGAQWLYWALLSQPELSMCGVLTITLERWANLADDASAKKVRGWLTELNDGRFIVHDTSTAEVWIRTYVRSDRVLETPNFFVAMARAFEAIHSERIRLGIVQQVREEFPEGLAEGLTERFPKAFPKGIEQRLPRAFLDRVCAHASARTDAGVTMSPSHHVTDSPVVNQSSSEEPLAAERSDDDDRIEATATAVTDRLELRLRPHTPARWRPTTLADQRKRAAAWFAEHPTGTTDQAVAALEPDPRPAAKHVEAPAAVQPPDFEVDDTAADWDSGRTALAGIRDRTNGGR